MTARRTFLALVGGTAGALTLGVRWTETHAAGPFAPNVWLSVEPDGLVSIVCSRSEMGQGIRSSLPAAIADELGADPARVKVVQGDGDARYGNQNTDGSRSVRDFLQPLRRAQDHVVLDPVTKKTLGFGELAEDAAKAPVPHSDAVRLRPDSELKRVGPALPLVDAPAYVTGRAAFGAECAAPAC